MKGVFSLYFIFVVGVVSVQAKDPDPIFFASWDRDIGAETTPGPTVPTSNGGVNTKSAVLGRGAIDLSELDSSLTFSDVVTDGTSGTVAIWWRPDFEIAANDSPKAILYWGSKVGPEHGELILRVADSKAPHDKLQLVARGLETHLVETPVRSWQSGEWHWVVATWTESELTLYVDGVVAGHSTFSDLAMSLNNLTIGSIFGNQAASAFDNLQIWSEALTEKEITGLYRDQSKAK